MQKDTFIETERGRNEFKQVVLIHNRKERQRLREPLFFFFFENEGENMEDGILEY